MILGQTDIQKLIKSVNLVEGLSERELKDPEGCVLDLRLDKVFSLSGKAFLGIDERETPETTEIATFDPINKSSFVFEPGKYYLVKTVEKINVPENMAAIFKPRMTTVRSGLVLRTGFANPGFSGVLFMGIKNEGDIPVLVEMGARFVQVIFLEVSSGSVHTYRGQWQGGRATTKGREKQI